MTSACYQWKSLPGSLCPSLSWAWGVLFNAGWGAWWGGRESTLLYGRPLLSQILCPSPARGSGLSYSKPLFFLSYANSQRCCKNQRQYFCSVQLTVANKLPCKAPVEMRLSDSMFWIQLTILCPCNGARVSDAWPGLLGGSTWSESPMCPSQATSSADSFSSRPLMWCTSCSYHRHGGLRWHGRSVMYVFHFF